MKKNINFGFKVYFFGSKYAETQVFGCEYKKRVALETNCVYKIGFVCLETWSDFAHMCENRVWTYTCQVTCQVKWCLPASNLMHYTLLFYERISQWG